MADHLDIKVSVTPIEELTDENSGTTKIIASEIGKTLSGSGTSVNLANYGNAAAGQGYLNGTVNYFDAVHTAAGAEVGLARDAFFIKNTGYKYSSATALGAATTDCVMVVLKSDGYINGSQSGHYTATDASEDHFSEVAWLKPGQAVVLPCAATNLSITQFGSNANDLSAIGSDSQNGKAEVYVRTFQSDGTAATDGNAVEYLCVT